MWMDVDGRVQMRKENVAGGGRMDSLAEYSIDPAFLLKAPHVGKMRINLLVLCSKSGDAPDMYMGGTGYIWMQTNSFVHTSAGATRGRR